MWERRVWRQIDLDDPTNKILGRPLGRNVAKCHGLFDILHMGIGTDGSLTPYQPGPDGGDDGFRSPITGPSRTELVSLLDTLNRNRVAGYRIKEDWIFDRHRSVMEVRIIGIAPILTVHGPEGELRGYRTLAWFYYPECRLLLSQWAAAGTDEGKRISYEAVFSQRLFKGVIIEVDNVHGRQVPAYRSGIDALIESEEIRQQLEQMGFDLWHY